MKARGILLLIFILSIISAVFIGYRFSRLLLHYGKESKVMDSPDTVTFEFRQGMYLFSGIAEEGALAEPGYYYLFREDTSMAIDFLLEKVPVKDEQRDRNRSGGLLSGSSSVRIGILEVEEASSLTISSVIPKENIDGVMIFPIDSPAKKKIERSPYLLASSILLGLLSGLIWLVLWVKSRRSL